VRQVAQMMIDLALEYPEYRAQAQQVRMLEISSGAYYGAGYQDVQNRVPKIDNTCRDLEWEPRVDMEQALRNIYDAYRGLVAEARGLVD
ncbi:MAG TPA: bifunctional UDP-4-keto-pentose/UDP-xylose synthase, partial [Burkholderiales bacterium]|nr:bifunctional UDP-4-keto-pentose/UDP-xylose synthase [Burkholderiales bacterium]